MTRLTPVGELLLIGLPMLIYLLAALALVPFVAWAKHRSAIGWAILALLLTPVLALIAPAPRACTCAPWPSACRPAPGPSACRPAPGPGQ